MQTLDVNIVSHTFKNHLDYVVLLRKLVLYLELKMLDKSRSQENLLMSGRTREQEEPSEEIMNFKIEIESAMRLRNPLNDLEPPNSFVHLELPFRGVAPSEINTDIL